MYTGIVELTIDWKHRDMIFGTWAKMEYTYLYFIELGTEHELTNLYINY